MKQRIYIGILITLFLTLQMDLFGQDTKKILKVLSKEMEVPKSNIQLEACTLNDLLREKVDAVYKLQVEGQQEGYVILARGMGRYDEFRFFLLTGLDKATEMVRVVNYISDHGGEISSKKWLGQFVGYKGGELKYGEDIQAISGATISARSITQRVHEIVSLLKETEIQAVY